MGMWSQVRDHTIVTNKSTPRFPQGNIHETIFTPPTVVCVWLAIQVQIKAKNLKYRGKERYVKFNSRKLIAQLRKGGTQLRKVIGEEGI